MKYYALKSLVYIQFKHNRISRKLIVQIDVLREDAFKAVCLCYQLLLKKVSRI